MPSTLQNNVPDPGFSEDKMAPGIEAPQIPKIQPRIRYNTIGGVNGPLVILDNVWLQQALNADRGRMLTASCTRK